MGQYILQPCGAGQSSPLRRAVHLGLLLANSRRHRRGQVCEFPVNPPQYFWSTKWLASGYNSGACLQGTTSSSHLKVQACEKQQARPQPSLCLVSYVILPVSCFCRSCSWIVENSRVQSGILNTMCEFQIHPTQYFWRKFLLTNCDHS